MKKLAPSLTAWLETYNRTLKELSDNGFIPTPASVRKGLADLTSSLVTHHPPIAWSGDDHVNAPHGPIPVRIFHPNPSERLGVMIYYHGGGHMAGSIQVYDPICRKMALATKRIVVSADYRLAPEHPYPAGVHDALTVATHPWEALDRQGLMYDRRLCIAGDSAGGALCATVAHHGQYDPTIEIDCQILIYPSLDYTMTLPSVENYGVGFLLEKEKMQWYFDHYFQNREDRRRASPLYMAFTSKLPKTLIVTAGFCPLQDEGLAYAEKIRSCGVKTEHLHFEEMVHAFLNMESLTRPACDTVYAAVGAFINDRRG